MTGKQVAKKGAAGVPAAGFDYGEAGGQGFEGTSGKDLSVPFLTILQSNSPQVEDDNPKGSKAGMLFNTVTKELISGDDGVVFIPCHKEEAFVEWVPRDKNGGFVGLHDPNGEVVEAAVKANGGNRIGKLKHGENELVETYYVYGLLLDPTGATTTTFAVLSFSSTKIKPYRDWYTAMYTLKGQPPIFANRACIQTEKQKNEKGTFFNFKIEPMGDSWMASLINPADEAGLLQEAVDFRKMVTSGMARAAFETERSAGDPSPEDGKAPF